MEDKEIVVRPLTLEPVEKKEKKTDSGETASLVGASLDSGALNDSIYRFNSKQGHGFAAERANTRIDLLYGREASILGDNNAKNGPDRMVDGTLIQTKYCRTAEESIAAGFDAGTKMYRYVKTDGTLMQIEVPSDQYEEAVQAMRRKISEGRVPGTKNPDDALCLVRKGNVTYETAVRISKAGNIDSLLFDASNGAVIARNAFGIAATVTFAHALWSGCSKEEAIDRSMCTGLQMGGTAFAASVISSQLTRTGLNAALQQPLIPVIKALPSQVRKSLTAVMKNGALAYGGGAAHNLAKLWSGNLITGAVYMMIMSAGDISRCFQGKISGKQLFKNMTTLGGSLAGGVAGGAAAGALLGPVGMAAGALAGGIAGGAGAHAVLDHFIEDDAVEMVRILNSRFVLLAGDYLLTEEEINLVLEDLHTKLLGGRLMDMFGSADRNKYADRLLEESIQGVIRLRVRIILPPGKDFVHGLVHMMTLGGHPVEMKNCFAPEKADTPAMGRAIMGHEISRHAADKAWYAARQMNLLNAQSEMLLQQMKDNERQHRDIRKKQIADLKACRMKLEQLLEE